MTRPTGFLRAEQVRTFEEVRAKLEATARERALADERGSEPERGNCVPRSDSAPIGSPWTLHPAMSFEAAARRYAEISLDALASRISDAARTELVDALHSAIDARMVVLQEALSPPERADILERLVEALSNVSREEAASLATSARCEAQEAAQAELAEARAEIDRTRLELQARLEQAQAAHAELAASLAEARQDAIVAKAEADACRRALDLAADEIRTLKEALVKREAAARERALADERRTTGVELTSLERVRGTLGAIGAATSGNEMLDTLLDHLGHQFARAAMFIVGQSSLTGWQGRGLGSMADIRKIAIPLTIDSPLTRAAASRTPATVEATGADAAVGVFGSPIGSAIALPVIANARVVAVAYAENPPEASTGPAGTECKIAEILLEQVNQRFTARPRSSQAPTRADRKIEPIAVVAEAGAEPVGYSPSRQVPRVKMQGGVEVILEGNTSVLVDLSLLGAQVLSPSATRPNRSVRMILPTGEGALTCKGRIVWALYELPRGGEAARYRAGMKFTDIDARALESFLIQRGMPEQLPDHDSLAHG